MAWLARDKNGFEYIYNSKPTRGDIIFESDNDMYVHLPEGSIKKLIGRDLSWSDEPVEI